MTLTASPSTALGEGKRVPVKEDFLTTPLWPLEEVRLKGTCCQECGETFLGKSPACENCQSTNLKDVVLSSTGTLYTYTVIRHRPPGDYLGPDPFEPFAVALVELPEGLRMLAPLTDVDVEKLEIGQALELKIVSLGVDAEGSEVIGFKFRPAQAG